MGFVLDEEFAEMCFDVSCELFVFSDFGKCLVFGSLFEPESPGLKDGSGIFSLLYLTEEGYVGFILGWWEDVAEFEGSDNQEGIEGGDNSSGFSHDIRMGIFGVEGLGECDDDGCRVGVDGAGCEVSIVVDGESTANIDHFDVSESGVVEVSVGACNIFCEGIDVAQNLGSWMSVNGDDGVFYLGLFEKVDDLEEVFDAESKL